MSNLLRTLLGAALFGSAFLLAAPAGAAEPASGIRLQPLQAHIYKTRDPGGERTESWIFWLLVETTAERDVTVRAARIQLRSGPAIIRTTSYDADGVKALTIVPPFPPRLLDGKPSPTPIFWPQAIRIRTKETQAAKVDGMHVELSLGEGDKLVPVAVDLPVETYEQKTSLI